MFRPQDVGIFGELQTSQQNTAYIASCNRFTTLSSTEYLFFMYERSVWTLGFQLRIVSFDIQFLQSRVRILIWGNLNIYRSLIPN